VVLRPLFVVQTSGQGRGGVRRVVVPHRIDELGRVEERWGREQRDQDRNESDARRECAFDAVVGSVVVELKALGEPESR
jgi:hypothetical protein